MAETIPLNHNGDTSPNPSLDGIFADFEKLCVRYADDTEEADTVALLQFVLRLRSDQTALGAISDVLATVGQDIQNLPQTEDAKELLTLLQEQIDCYRRNGCIEEGVRSKVKKLF